VFRRNNAGAMDDAMVGAMDVRGQQWLLLAVVALTVVAAVLTWWLSAVAVDTAAEL
jgi:hypothetical protein